MNTRYVHEHKVPALDGILTFAPEEQEYVECTEFCFNDVGYSTDPFDIIAALEDTCGCPMAFLTSSQTFN